MQPNETEFSQLSATDFEMLGMDHVAYVKVVSDGTSLKYAVHAADGSEIALMEADRDVTFAVVRQNDMEPVSVH
ncbi:MAG: hypothetical protein CMM16_04630 [Rhodospirillaceae bacterium]|jgi:hypothetical protein|nr:hypothetical protein [Rhodospirillaceae bacterium]